MKLITRLACGPSPSPCFPSPAPRIGVTLEAGLPLPFPSLKGSGDRSHTIPFSHLDTARVSGEGLLPGQDDSVPIQWQRIHRLPDLLSLSTRGRSSRSHSSALNIHNQMMTSTLLIRPLSSTSGLTEPKPPKCYRIGRSMEQIQHQTPTLTHTHPPITVHRVSI